MRIELLTNKDEQERIDLLIKDIVDNPRKNAVVLLEEVDLKYFYGNDYRAKLEYIETDNIDLVKSIKKKPKLGYNLCIVEIKDIKDKEWIKISNEFVNKKDLVAVTINNCLPTKYRINYLYK